LVTEHPSRLTYSNSFGDFAVDVNTTTYTLLTNSGAFTGMSSVALKLSIDVDSQTTYECNLTIDLVTASFSSDVTSINVGGTVTFSPVFSSGTAKIQPGDIDVTTGDTYPVNPSGTAGTTVPYYLVLTDPITHATASIELDISIVVPVTTTFTIDGWDNATAPTIYVADGQMDVDCLATFNDTTYGLAYLLPDNVQIFTGVDIYSTPPSSTVSDYYVQFYTLDTGTDSWVEADQSDHFSVVSTPAPALTINDNTSDFSISNGSTLTIVVTYDDTIFLSATLESTNDATNNGMTLTNGGTYTITPPDNTVCDYVVSAQFPGGNGVYSNTINVTTS
jgi:hypothetical protein